MNPKYRRTKVTLIVVMLIVVLAVLTVASTQAKGPAEHSREDVVKFGFEGQYPPEEDGEAVGHSNLVRKSNGVQVQVKTSELIPGGVYSYWFLSDEPEVSNDPDGFPFDLIIWADYVIVGSNGKANTNLKLETGTAGIANNPTIFLDEGLPGLNDPYGAAIEIELVYHGQADDPTLTDEWFTTFWVGDVAECIIDAPYPVPLSRSLIDPTPDPICPLAQITFHAP